MEIERKIAAICIHYHILPDQVDDRLFVNSGRDTKMIIAKEEHGNLVIANLSPHLKSEIRQNKIDVWIIDPFVRSHASPRTTTAK